MQEGTLDVLISDAESRLGASWGCLGKPTITKPQVLAQNGPFEDAERRQSVRFSRESSHAHPVALGVEGRGVGRERSAIQRSASRSAPKLMQKALSSWRPRPIPLIASVDRGGTSRGRGKRVVRRTARAAGRAETFHSPSSPERRCVPAVVPSRSVSSPSPVGKVDDPRPVALTWGGAGVDHTPYPIPQAPHTRLGHYSPIANSQNSFLKACTEEFFWSEIFWNLPWIGCVRRGVWGMGYGVRIGRYPIPHTPRSTHPTWSTLSHRDSQSSLE